MLRDRIVRNLKTKNYYFHNYIKIFLLEFKRLDKILQTNSQKSEATKLQNLKQNNTVKGILS